MRTPMFGIDTLVAVMYQGKWQYGKVSMVDVLSVPGSILYLVYTDDGLTIGPIHEAFLHFDDVDDEWANQMHDLADLIIGYVQRVYSQTGKDVNPADMAQHSSFVGFSPQQIANCIQYLQRLGMLIQLPSCQVNQSK